MRSSSLPPTGVLSVRSRRAGNLIALYRPLVLVHLTRKLDAEEIAVLREVVDEGLREGVQGGMLVVFARKELSGGLDPRARELFESLMRRSSEAIGLSGVVIQSEGFAGAVVRGFVTGLLQLVGSRGKLKAFSTVSEAIKALSVAHKIDGAELRAVYESALGPAAPP